MRRLSFLLLIGLAAWGIAAWVRERRARTVYSAGEAAALLHPARRLLQDPAKLVRMFGVRDGDRVLEIGPGPGYFTAEAARAAGERGAVVCVDVQRGMIDELCARLPADVASRVRMVVGDATRLPLAAASFDRAFLVAVLGETPSHEAVASELARVLRPGGMVAFCETLTDPDYVREGTLRALCEEAGLRFIDRRRQVLGYVMRFARDRSG